MLVQVSSISKSAGCACSSCRNKTLGPGQIAQFKDVMHQLQPQPPRDCRLLALLLPELLGLAIPRQLPANLAGIGPG